MRHAVPHARHGPVRLLDVDLDLFDALGPDEAGAAVNGSLVETVLLPTGLWGDAGEFAGTHLYVISGLLSCGVSVEEHRAVELLPSGRLFTTKGVDRDAAGPTLELDWEVLEPSWLAVLDGEFWRAMSAYPALTLALIDRAQRRADELGARLAIAAPGPMTERVMALLRELAATHGRVVRDGMLIDLRLSTTLLAQLLPASRSRVSDSVQALVQQRRLARRDDKRFLLLDSAAASNNRP